MSPCIAASWKRPQEPQYLYWDFSRHVERLIQARKARVKPQGDEEVDISHYTKPGECLDAY
mgnify:CR=1 FL=1